MAVKLTIIVETKTAKSDRLGLFSLIDHSLNDRSDRVNELGAYTF